MIITCTVTPETAGFPQSRGALVFKLFNPPAEIRRVVATHEAVGSAGVWTNSLPQHRFSFIAFVSCLTMGSPAA